MNQQGSAEWIQERLGRFTASEIHKLIPQGKGGQPFSDTGKTYILEKLVELETGFPASEIYGPAVEWGSDKEPMARDWYTRITGNEVQEAYFEPYGTHAGGSPDGLVGELGIIEIKCPFKTVNHFKYRMARKADDLPAEYFWQIQMNLLCTGRSWCDFVSFDPRVRTKELGIFILRVSAGKSEQELLKSRIADAVLLLNQYREQVAPVEIVRL
jgi:putative phage-type endonuclease